jgi:hypothetical protein
VFSCNECHSFRVSWICCCMHCWIMEIQWSKELSVYWYYVYKYIGRRISVWYTHSHVSGPQHISRKCKLWLSLTDSFAINPLSYTPVNLVSMYFSMYAKRFFFTSHLIDKIYYGSFCILILTSYKKLSLSLCMRVWRT